MFVDPLLCPFSYFVEFTSGTASAVGDFPIPGGAGPSGEFICRFAGAGTVRQPTWGMFCLPPFENSTCLRASQCTAASCIAIAPPTMSTSPGPSSMPDDPARVATPAAPVDGAVVGAVAFTVTVMVAVVQVAFVHWNWVVWSFFCCWVCCA